MAPFFIVAGKVESERERERERTRAAETATNDEI